MGEAIRSIEDAIETFSRETKLVFTTQDVNYPVPEGVAVKGLICRGEPYGRMAFIKSEDGVMESCAYRGKHPLLENVGGRHSLILGVDRVGTTGSEYIRGDDNQTPFLGVCRVAENAKALRYLRQ